MSEGTAPRRLFDGISFLNTCRRLQRNDHDLTKLRCTCLIPFVLLRLRFRSITIEDATPFTHAMQCNSNLRLLEYAASLAINDPQLHSWSKLLLTLRVSFVTATTSVLKEMVVAVYGKVQALR
jgi:hypothetical protein